MRTRITGMFTLLLTVLAFSLVLTGCKSAEDKAKDRLVGVWNADMSTMVIEDMPEEQLTAIQAMFAESTMELTLNADGTSSTAALNRGEEENETGTWAVVSVDGDTIVVVTEEESAEEETHEGEEVEVEGPNERTVIFNGDDEFEMVREKNDMMVHITFTRGE